MAEKYTKLISTKITPEMIEELKDLADEEDRTLSNMVRVLITEALFHRKAGTKKDQGVIGQRLFDIMLKGYQDVMQAGLIHEGQHVILEYGPMGQPKQVFEGILRREGVEVDGRVMSLSAAAVYCIQKAGSDRKTANGWIMWKTEDGAYLSDFYNQVYSDQRNDDDEGESA